MEIKSPELSKLRKALESSNREAFLELAKSRAPRYEPGPPFSLSSKYAIWLGGDFSDYLTRHAKVRNFIETELLAHLQVSLPCWHNVLTRAIFTAHENQQDQRV